MKSIYLFGIKQMIDLTNVVHRENKTKQNMNIPHYKELDYKMRVFCETVIIWLAISRNGRKCSCFQAKFVTVAI